MKDFADLIATLGRVTWRALDLMRVCAARDRAAIVEHFAHLGSVVKCQARIRSDARVTAAS
ncbi:hypothetical protein ACWCXX_37760 [Streptomyces sp. NPDC001732]